MIVDILPVDEKHVDQALSSHFTDFEDAIQYYLARSSHIDFFITRNKRDYKHSLIPVCTPTEYLAILRSG